jgi:glycosyltransferase involved in cell wall biosynthesis
MPPPLVSILIPCYNAGPWLRAALDSAFGQTHPHVEVVLVNDGSSDESASIAAEYEPRGLRLITQENAGQCAAANRAFRESRGGFVKFLDADDVLDARAIELQIAAIERSGRDLAYGEWGRFWNDPAEAEFPSRPGARDGDPSAWLLDVCADSEPMFQCGLWLIRRGLIERAGGWDERLSLINDYEFFMRLVTRGNGVAFSPGARVFYRSGVSGSLSGKKSAAAWRSAHLSVTLGVGHFLALDDSPPRPRLAARMLQNLVYQMYPAEPELIADLEDRIRRLGGSDNPPPMGPRTRLLARALGWRTVWKLKSLLAR